MKIIVGHGKPSGKRFLKGETQLTIITNQQNTKQGANRGSLFSYDSKREMYL